MYTILKRSGSMVEEYVYERAPAPKKGPRKPRRRRIVRMRRADNISRLRGNFGRLVRANLSLDNPPCLLTLTMRDVVSVDIAYKCLTRFFVKFRRVYGRDIGWAVVPEFQKRGAVHFHALIFGLKHEAYKDERSTRAIANLWGQGFVDTLATDGSPKLATYLSKYMSKAMHDYRLVGKKAYSASRNLMRPVSLSSDCTLKQAWAMFKGDIETVDKSLDDVKEYGTLWLGRCVYKRYTILPL